MGSIQSTAHKNNEAVSRVIVRKKLLRDAKNAAPIALVATMLPFMQSQKYFNFEKPCILPVIAARQRRKRKIITIRIGGSASSMEKMEKSYKSPQQKLQ